MRRKHLTPLPTKEEAVFNLTDMIIIVAAFAISGAFCLSLVGLY